MPRYEFKEGSSNKFWQIDLDGAAFTTTYGKIGTPGQTSMKEWKDVAQAKKEYDKLVAEKTKKGYALVGKAAAAPAKAKTNGKAAAAPAAKPAAKPAKGKAAAAGAPAAPKKNAALEKALDADPENGDAWAVYADWLTEQGDPRGELAAVQERLIADPKNKELLSAEKKLLKEHEGALIGKIAKYMYKPGTKAIPGALTKPPLGPDARTNDSAQSPIRVGWRGGFFSWAFIGYPGTEDFDAGGDDDDDGDSGELDVGKLIVEALSNPSARFLSSLTIGLANSPEDGENDYNPIIKKLATVDAASRLRNLYIGHVTQEESEVSWLEIGDVSKLWPKLSKLRALTLRGGSMKLGTMALPELRELTIITGGFDKKNLASICAAKWPKLEKLEIWFGQKSYGGNTTIKDIKPILDAKGFPALKHLGLCNCEFVDEIAAALPDAKILKQLQVLDLSEGTLTEAGVKALADAKGAFAHLTRVDLSNNYIGKAEKLASSINKAVRTKPQRNPSEYGGEVHRYAALGE